MTNREVAIEAAVDLSVAIAKHRDWWFVKLYGATVIFGCILHFGFDAPPWAAFGFGATFFWVEYARQEIVLYLMRSERASMFREHPDIFAEVNEQFEELKSDKKFWRGWG